MTSRPAQNNNENQTDLEAWEAALREFRKRCQTSGIPSLDELNRLVRTFPSDQQADMLVNLVCEHMRESWRRNQGGKIEDYIERLGGEFDDFRSVDTIPTEIVECEFLARFSTAQPDDTPTIADYEIRYANRQDVLARLRDLCRGDCRYVLIRRQGQGGLGRVWVGYDCHLKRYVAIKEPNAAVADDNRIVRSLVQEARISAGLDHPGIIAVHELRDHEGEQPFYVMRLMEGQTLRERIQEYHHDGDSNQKQSRRVEWNELLQAYINVCEAVAFAHEHAVIHRDLKPENIVLGKYGETVVLDWGLAKQIEAPSSVIAGDDRPASGISVQADKDTVGETVPVTSESLVAGTPQYMSQEQARGRPEIRSDVFALGAVLYEILTGKPPYQLGKGEKLAGLLARVKSGDFVSPRAVSPKVPLPLEAVCLKAMESKLDRRYPNAGAIAEEIRHWMADEPVSAFREFFHHRIVRKVRRHVGMTVVGVIAGLVLLVGLSVASFHVYRTAKRQDMIAQLHEFQLDQRHAGWSGDAWELVQETARIDVDSELQNLAVASLLGLDADLVTSRGFPASNVAFDADGLRVLASGDGHATVWDSMGRVLHASSRTGRGPVLFTPDGVPWHVIAESPRKLVIWDVQSDEQVRVLKSNSSSTEEEGNAEELTSLEITPNGSMLAAAISRPNGTGTILVWDIQKGEIIRRFEIAATALAFSGDQQVLAAGGPSGTVIVWSLDSGNELARFGWDPLSIHSLAFTSNPRREVDEEPSQWLLAVGNSGGTITVWDLSRKIPLAYLRGSKHHIFDVEFSPDGTMLASCGRYFARLWDVASGEQLLALPAGNTYYSLAFAFDGKRVAIASIDAHEASGRVSIYELGCGPDVQSLRGLCGSVVKVWFSHDQRLLAALGSDWRVGVWDATTGRLRHILSVPPGFFTDNSDLAFSPDSRKVAFAAKDRATLWDVATGKCEKSWTLPPGLGDCIRFHGKDKLLLFRFETKKKQKAPMSDAPPADHPRVCRLRDLMSDDPLRPIKEIAEFNQHVFVTTGSPDGGVFLVDGIHADGVGDNVRTERTVRAFDGLTGEQKWSRTNPRQTDGGALAMDPSGRLIIAGIYKNLSAVIDLESHKIVRDRVPADCLSPRAKYMVANSNMDLLHSDSNEPFLRLAETRATDCHQAQFTADGKYFAWGTRDGTVFICEVEVLLEQLREVDLIK